MLPKINPTKTNAWKKLKEHSRNMKKIKIKDLFKDKERFEKFSVKFDDMVIDYSKNLITEETLKIFMELADEVKLKDAIDAMFSGERINETENRKVLHTWLRNFKNEGNEMKEIMENLSKIKEFSEKIINGEWKGYTGKKIRTIVNVGIGGSSLGVEFLKEALVDYKKDIEIYFITSTHYQNLKILNLINPEETLFVISSKSFSTIETIENAKFIINLKKGIEKQKFLEKNFVAITANEKKANEFGIKNVIKFGEYINGRCSIWGATGFPIACYIGFENFLEFLKGAREIDEHFINTSFDKNVPVILGLLDVYYNNFLNFIGTAIICYDKYLENFYKYVQQLWMESNGKNVDRNGNFINYNTAGIIFGGVGTDVQHSFFQLLHQGTRKILCDFIGVANHKDEVLHLHNILISAFFGQTEALMNGKTKKQVMKELEGKMSKEEIKKILNYKIFTGNRPTNSILLKSITPRTIGKLIALYEHRIFVEGIVENIYSFDQFGVELGKEMANEVLKYVEGDKINENISSSTLNLIKIYKEWKCK